ncbi:MAG: glycosyltransferase [Acidobacteria bacterium]|nr:glycosyltransferase [Acidobacteriota bacterium]
MRKPDAWLLAPEAPYPLIGGGPARTASLVEHLARRYALDVVVFREPGAADPAAAFPPGLVRDIRVIELPAHSKRPAARAWRNLRRFLRGRPPLVDRFSGFESAVADSLRGRRYALAVVEHFWCAAYARQVAAHAETLVLDLHNIESVLHAQASELEPWPARAVFRRFAAACRALEQRWLPRYSLLLAASTEDARRVGEIAPGCRCEVYPNAIPLVAQPVREEEHVVAVSGNWEYHPNVSAVRLFRDRIWPRLRARWPELRWRLIGRNPEAVRRYVACDQRIELTGPVQDAVRELAAAQVVVAPLVEGSGTRVKIIEAWAAARAVVATPVGAEGLPGLDGEHLLVAETPERFVEAVSGLLGSAAQRFRLGRAGRSLYEQQLSWEAAWRGLERLGI